MIFSEIQHQLQRVKEIIYISRLKEIVRYGIVGLALNFLGYVIYLLATSLGLTPLMTVTIFYPLGVVMGYFAHRRHTFRRKSQSLEGALLIRYVVVYLVGYLINSALLKILHEQMGYPHQIIQIFAIFFVALFLFIGMKLFVFR